MLNEIISFFNSPFFISMFTGLIQKIERIEKKLGEKI